VSLPFNIYSWIDFKNHLEGKSTLEKGTAFEELTKLYLEYHPVYRTKLKTVWLQKDIPTRKSLGRLSLISYIHLELGRNANCSKNK